MWRWCLAAAVCLALVAPTVSQAAYSQRFGGATTTYTDGGTTYLLIYGGYSYNCDGSGDCHWDDNDWSDDDVADYHDATAGSFIANTVRIPLSNPTLASTLLTKGPTPPGRAFASISVTKDGSKLVMTGGITAWGRSFNSLDIRYSCGMNDIWTLDLSSLTWERLKAHSGVCESSAASLHVPVAMLAACIGLVMLLL